ncbi:hypothetical protein HNQ94_000179 [Salirhabdus euzebyi]|uniref:Putative amidase domain-containing protein n=1 Tax=Salirhabdus euzebyi TaxID=394506 RepID=A0A841Q2W8_9BACI|nr:amidase domain-containing protein [Salirhabdus euzebyi]MBB6451758.1 hypothetical protein [Salirhabdus euzebyi]
MSKHILQQEWENMIFGRSGRSQWWKKKKADYDKRGVKVLQVAGDGQPFHRLKAERSEDEVFYLVHLTMLLKQEDEMFLEELIFPFKVKLDGDKIISHEMMSSPIQENAAVDNIDYSIGPEEYLREGKRSFSYDRRKAVQYAERWWNDYNPDYHKFDVDCTNYISQCLHAGGAAMWGEPNRSKGWWYNGTNWSYSWSVANAMRWYLSGAHQGLTAIEKEHATDLMPGDVICYDFEGDGKWNHTTIVVAKDGNGEPLVNAHTENSRHRYWKYEDSTAWTPDIQYKFFHIGG